MLPVLEILARLPVPVLNVPDVLPTFRMKDDANVATFVDTVVVLLAGVASTSTSAPEPSVMPIAAA